MRHKNIALFALSAALLLSGCNMDKAATTTADATAVTEEVTTAVTTEVTTTTKATTTTAATTAATTTTATTNAVSETVSDIPTEFPEEKTFEVQEMLISQLERGPDVGSFSDDYRVVNDKAFERHWVAQDLFTADEFMDRLKQMTSPFWKKYVPELEKDLAGYLDDGKLDLDKLRKLPKVSSVQIFDRKRTPGRWYDSYDEYVIDGKWMISVDSVTGDILISLYDDEYTALRRVLELLWSMEEITGYMSEMSLVALTEITFPYEYKQTLEIIAEADELEKIKAYLTSNEADLSDCELLTPDEMRAKWLPVTYYKHYDGKYTPISFERLRAFDSGVYMIDDYKGVISSDIALIRVGELCGGEEREKLADAMTEHGIKQGVYETVEPYADMFDPVKLPTEHGNCYRINENFIIEETFSQKYEYKLWVFDKQHTDLRRAVLLYRENPDLQGSIWEYKIKSIEYVVEGYDANEAPMPDGYTLRIVADEKYWEDIKNYAGSGEHIPVSKDCFFLAEESVLKE